eukprot:TRINITY_DN4977_c0_g1_i9.p2 TRINITY_DN4977_c0_g1~~TRINITY_DN4977_c0_g1_i9.p2  ORF type:complete len:433 (+),score=47.54 TRINITY_DN4977_c0_g1_i9:141-1439(+)
MVLVLQRTFHFLKSRSQGLRWFSSMASALEQSQPIDSTTQNMAYSVDDYVELLKAQRQFVNCTPQELNQNINGLIMQPNQLRRSKDVRVVSYNILANKYIGEHVKYTQSALLRWELRKQKVVAEIEHYQADVLLLQEVEQDVFKYDFLKLRELGFTGIIASGEAPPALFYRSKLFKLLDFEINSFQSLLNSPSKLAAAKSAWGVQKEVDQHGRAIMNGGYFFTRLKYTANGGYAMALLQHIPTNTPILVVSVHLFWNPAWPDIKIGQAALLCQRLRTFLQEGGYQGSEVSQMPCIIGGDFNSMHKKTYTDEYDELPKGKEYLVSGVYSLLRNGQLDSEHHDHPLTRRRTEEKLVFNTAGFNFESIYNKGGWNEPHNTNKTSEFAGCLDYVFVSPHFEVQELLQTLQEDSDPYLTLGYPSDHLAIGGLLSLNL